MRVLHRKGSKVSATLLVGVAMGAAGYGLASTGSSAPGQESRQDMPVAGADGTPVVVDLPAGVDRFVDVSTLRVMLTHEGSMILAGRPQSSQDRVCTIRVEPDGETSIGCHPNADLARRGVTFVGQGDRSGRWAGVALVPDGVTTLRVHGRATQVSGNVASVGVEAAGAPVEAQGPTGEPVAVGAVPDPRALEATEREAREAARTELGLNVDP